LSKLSEKNSGSQSKNPLKLCFYGDDFTGSTDVLEQLAIIGLPAILFIKPPTPDMLQKYPGVQAVGIAGTSRAMKPSEMEVELRGAFAVLKKLGAPHVHYKVCSTFDSSSGIGSIGRAMDVGAKIFGRSFIPIVASAPRLGRYCLFGNLFARYGIGTAGKIHRLDRHPSISRHPVTPMMEADLVYHLSRQTKKKIKGITVIELTETFPLVRKRLHNLVQNEGAEVVLFDALDDSHMNRIGELLIHQEVSGKPLFTVGSSGFEAALGAHWKSSLKGKIFHAGASNGPVIVASGSCSPVTTDQIKWAVSHGFAEVKLDVSKLMRKREALGESANALVGAIKHLRNKKNVVIHTNAASNRVTHDKVKDSSRNISTALGKILLGVLGQSLVARICIAGGDTSGIVAHQLGIESLKLASLLTPGAPVCIASAPDSPVDGLEIVFKGGQVGGVEFFETALKGIKLSKS
jgi:uncharacterized protein YgbK (DUF1537 family)